MRNHSGKDCSNLTTVARCRSRNTSPLALISEFAKCFLPWSGLGISQKQAIHMWSSALVKLLIKGVEVALAQVFAPRPLRAESWMTRGTFLSLLSVYPSPAIVPEPTRCPRTSPAHMKILLFLGFVLATQSGLWTGSISIAWELIRSGVSGLAPYRLNPNVWLNKFPR